MEKIGMVGVGAMGSALLERLNLAAVRATAFDRYAPALEAARSMGADIAPSAAAVARASTMVDVVVRTDQEVLDCVMGRDGILEGAQAGTLVLLHSTILPQTTRKVADAARGRNVHVIDACMLGVPRTVKAGELIFLVGGPAELIDRAKPHLLHMGKQLLHIGPLGAGNAGKIIKNLTTGAETLLMHEALQLGEAAGLRYPELLEILRQVDTERLLSRWQQVFDPSGANPAPRVGRNIFQKDLPLAVELARQSGLNLPIIERIVAAGRRLVEAQASS